MVMIYYDLRNLGTTSQDRALNFAATNAFQTVMGVFEALATSSIEERKSPDPGTQIIASSTSHTLRENPHLRKIRLLFCCPQVVILLHV